MDAVLRELLRALAANDPELAELIRQLLSGQVNPAFIANFVPILIANCSDRALLIRILAWLARLGLLPSTAVADATLAAEVAAAAQAEAAVATGATVTVTAATAAVAMATIIIVALSIYHIYDVYGKAHATPPLYPGGPPCKGDPEMGIAEYRVKGWSVFGGVVGAFEDAMKKAQEHCATLSAKCHGDCPRGNKCKPNPSVQHVAPRRHFGYSDVKLRFRCPCECF